MSHVVAVRTKTRGTYWYLESAAGKKTRISAALATELRAGGTPRGGTKPKPQSAPKPHPVPHPVPEPEPVPESPRKTTPTRKPRSRAKARVAGGGGGGRIPVFSVAGHAGSGKTHLCETWDDKRVTTRDLDYVEDVAAEVRAAQDAGQKAIIFCGLNESNRRPPRDRFADIPNVTKVWREVSLDNWIKRGLLRRGAGIDLADERKVAQALAWVKAQQRAESKKPKLSKDLGLAERIMLSEERADVLRLELERSPSELDALSELEVRGLVTKMKQAWGNGYSSSIDELVYGVGRDRKEKHLAMGYLEIPEGEVADFIKARIP
jgi:hypothetical protein